MKGWAQQKWKWVAFGVGLAFLLGLIIFLVVYFTVLQQDDSQVSTVDARLSLADHGQQTVVREPGEIIQLVSFPPRPGTEWSLEHGKPSTESASLRLLSFTPFTNGVSVRLPLNIYEDSLVLRHSHSNAKKPVDTLIHVKPALRLKYLLGEDSAPLKPQQTVYVDLAWTFPFPAGQLWAMELSAYPDMRTPVLLNWSLVPNGSFASDFGVNMNRKRLSFTVPSESNRLPSKLLYWRLTALGLFRPLSLVSPVPLKLKTTIATLPIFELTTLTLDATEFMGGKSATLSIGYRGLLPEDLSCLRVYYSLETTSSKVNWVPLINPNSNALTVVNSTLQIKLTLPEGERSDYTLRADMPPYMTSTVSPTYTITKEPLLANLTLSPPPVVTTSSYPPSTEVRVTLSWTQGTPSVMFSPLVWEHSFTGGQIWQTVSSAPFNGLMNAQRSSMTYSYILPNSNVSKYLLRVKYKNTVSLVAPIDIVSPSNPDGYVPTSLAVNLPVSGIVNRRDTVTLTLYFTGIWPNSPPVYTFTSNLGALTEVTRLSPGVGSIQYTARFPDVAGTSTITLPQLSLSAAPVPVASGLLRSIALSEVTNVSGPSPIHGITSGSTVKFDVDVSSNVTPGSIEVKYSVNGGAETLWTPSTAFQFVSGSVGSIGTVQGAFVVPSLPLASNLLVHARYVGGSVTSYVTTMFVVKPVLSCSFPTMGSEQELIVSGPRVYSLQSRACHSLCQITCLKSPHITFTGSSVGRVKLRETGSSYRSVLNQMSWVAGGNLYVAWYTTVQDFINPPTRSDTSEGLQVQVAYEYTDGSTGLTVSVYHPRSLFVRLNTDWESEPLLGTVGFFVPSNMLSNAFVEYEPTSSGKGTIKPGATGRCFWVPRWADGFDPRYNGHLAWIEPAQTFKKQWTDVRTGNIQDHLWNAYLTPNKTLESLDSIVVDTSGKRRTPTLFSYVYPGQNEGFIMTRSDGSRYVIGSTDSGDIQTTALVKEAAVPSPSSLYQLVSTSRNVWVDRIEQVTNHI